MTLPTLAYQAGITPAARLLLCRLWDYACPTTVPSVWWGTVYKLQLRTDLRMSPGMVDRSVRELSGTSWLLSFEPTGDTGAFLFELYTGEESCLNGI